MAAAWARAAVAAERTRVASPAAPRTPTSAAARAAAARAAARCGGSSTAAARSGGSGGRRWAGAHRAVACARVQPAWATGAGGARADKLLTNKIADAELYCERSIAQRGCHRLSCAVDSEDGGVPVRAPTRSGSQAFAAKELGIKLMTRQEKNELARKEGKAFLLRGQAETRLCDYDTAMRTFQLGCKADARLGPEALKELYGVWLAAKEPAAAGGARA